jgi:hypothetical protein
VRFTHRQRWLRKVIAMLVGMTALSWVVLLAMVGAWPAAGLLALFVVRSWRRHDRRLAADRAEAAAGGPAQAGEDTSGR